MGIMVGLPSPSGSEKDLQLNFGKNMTVQVEMRAPHLPAEWHTQSGIQLTWPHAGTDWAYMLTEVQECFINIAREIAERELLLIVTPEPEAVREQIASSVNIDNVRFLECETNDTWARDHGAITMIDNGTPSLLDFTFNGWGLKFASDLDNRITRHAVEAEVLKGHYVNRLGFVLEGGSIESDGMGTLLTTSKCLLSLWSGSPMNIRNMNKFQKITCFLIIFYDLILSSYDRYSLIILRSVLPLYDPCAPRLCIPLLFLFPCIDSQPVCGIEIRLCDLSG